MVLAALALASVLASTGSVPHTHLGSGPGLYNEEHDLAYLATLSAALLTVAGPTLVVGVAVRTLPELAPTPLVAPARRYTDPRAPPSS